MKIIELLITDFNNVDLGIEGIALVDKPAHESNWQMFEKTIDPFLVLDQILTEEQQIELVKLISQRGQNEKDLLDEGYVLVGVEPLTMTEFFKEFNVNGVNIYSTPNTKSSEDSLGSRKKRYKYVGPKDTKNRRFCGAMMEANKIFRIEDIQEMTEKQSNNEFGYYNIFQYRGSYNCRHQWVALYYEPKTEIINNAKRRKGLADVQAIPQESTMTSKTAESQASKNESTSVVLKVLDIIDDIPLFDNIEQAEKMAQYIGCKGYHTHTLENGTIGYMPCEEHNFESYNDYPKAASENACKVLRWIDEHGREEVQGMTQVGLARANQLCKNENISEETIARMASFERHRKNAEINSDFKGTPWKDAGYVAWLGWGGDEGVAWAQRKLDQIREEMESSISGIGSGNNSCGCMNIDVQTPVYVNQVSGQTVSQEVLGLEDACWPGYEAIGLKDKNGKQVPNCVKIENSKQEFSYDEEKKEVIGAALIPNKMIIRRDSMTGEMFYVYFSEDTIKTLSEKFMKDKLLDSTNLDHTSIKAKTFVSESWIIEDPLNDKSKSLGFSLPKGTWMIKMKVDSNELWEDIKKGKYNGFSVEGIFQEKLIFNNIKY
jgi:hypothetical protein